MRFLCFFLLLPFLIMAQGLEKNSSYRPLIILDAGHGGLNIGARFKNPYCEEKRLTLCCAHLTKRFLEKMGYRVSLTRSRDFFVPLQRRVEFANRAKSALFVSIHFDSCPNKDAHGIGVYFPKLAEESNKRQLSSKKLAATILKRAVFRTKGSARNIKKGNFYVLRETHMPAVLIEGGFLSNLEERKELLKKDYMQNLARGIAEGIDYFVKK